MRRHAPAAIMFLVGLLTGLLVTARRPPPAPPPPVSFADDFSVSRMGPPNAEVLVMRPYAVTIDGRTEFAGGHPPEQTRWVVRFGSGRVAIACELVERR